MKKLNTATNKLEIKTETGEIYNIPEEGSLGLLALGYAGLMTWREKRNTIIARKQISKNA